MPAWALDGDVHPFGAPTRAVLLAVAVVNLVIDGFANPIVEEIYFRGHLLPRLGRLGVLAPLMSVALFALGHAWQPQNIPLIFATTLPMVIVAWRTRSFVPSAVVHVVGNTLGATLTLAALLSR